jgi:ferrous iron transport protein B
MSFLARKKAFGRKPISRIALVGNPNVGKSVIFNWLTGKYATVSNYPGTTVEIGQGNMKLGHQLQEVIDTPGINSLVPMSEEERVTRNILLQDGDLKVIQVSDAKNLSRSLIITQQLAEMEKPVVLVLNMADEAKERGISIDVQGLSAILGIPVHATVAVRRKGLENLEKSLADGRQPQISVNFGPEIEESIKEIEKLLPERQ